MLLKSDIIDWFKEQKSHHRVDLLCSLLNHCVPFENRFIGTYVQMLVKKDSLSMHDSEVVASLDMNQLAWTSSESVSLSDEKVRRHLIMSLAFLRPEKRLGARAVFKLLSKPSTLEYLKSLKANTKLPSLRLVNEGDDVYSELLLIYTMALYHPVFTFAERASFNESYMVVLESLSRGNKAATDLLEQGASSQLGETLRLNPAYPLPPQSNGLVSQSPAPDKGMVSVSLKNRSWHNSGRHKSVSDLPGEISTSKPSESLEKLSKDLDSMKCESCLVSVIDELQERVGKDHSFSSFSARKIFEKFSLSELSTMNDQQLQKLGLKSSLIDSFRQVLNNRLKVKACNGMAKMASSADCSRNCSLEESYFQQYPPLVPESDIARNTSTKSPSPSTSGSSSACQLADNPAECSSSLAQSSASSDRINNSTNSSPAAAGLNTCPSVSTQQHQQSRGSSLPPELSVVTRVPTAMSFSGPLQPTPYYVSASPPPANPEGNLPLFPCQNFIPMGPVSPGSESQPPYVLATSAPAPGTPQGLAFPFPGNFLLQGHMVAQPMGATLRRPSSLIEMPTFVPPCTFLFSTPDLDFSRPPPQNYGRPISCFNCGAAGHRGDDCREHPTSFSGESRTKSS